MSPASHRRYTLRVFLAWIGLLMLVFSFNSLIDPLWHLGGNRLSGENFGFNERIAKINRFLRAPHAYDCVIFGSSRSTLMPEDAFAPYRCVNLAFSSGQVAEFLAYARYLKRVGFAPKLVVVGVDGFGFRKNGLDPVTLPGFITAFEKPPGIIEDYLAAGSLVMSWHALTRASSPPRFYDARFQGTVAPDAPTFRPQASLEAEGLRRAPPRRVVAYVPDKAVEYAELVALFPDARVLGYVPPISAWHVKRMAAQATLASYTEALHAVAMHFPVFIDFSLPSPLTWRTDTTYDGSHYVPAVQRRIAQTLFSAQPGAAGVNVKALDASSYLEAFQQALARFSGVPREQP